MDSKPAVPSTEKDKKKEDDEEFLAPNDLKTAVETQSLTNVHGLPPPEPAPPATPRAAWAHVTPSSQPRIVPAKVQSQADRDAQEIADSTKRALETLRNSSNPNSRTYVPLTTTPNSRAKSPWRPFSGTGGSLKAPSTPGIQTAVAAPSPHGLHTAIGTSPAPTASLRAPLGVASPAQKSSVRTATPLSPDVRTGIENSGREKMMKRTRREASTSGSRSNTRTATLRSPDVRTGIENSGREKALTRTRIASQSGIPTAVGAGLTASKQSKKSRKSECSTIHTASTNYEIDLRQRTHSGSSVGPTNNVSTVLPISPARVVQKVPSRSLIPTDRPENDYPPLPSEVEQDQSVELVDSNSEEYKPHISRPMLLSTGTGGMRTARSHSPARRLFGSSAKSPSKSTESEKSLRTAKSPARTQKKPQTTVISQRTQRWSPKTSQVSSGSQRSGRPPKHPNRSQKSASQSSLATTSARSFKSDKTWASRKSVRAHKSRSETPGSITARSSEFSQKSIKSKDHKTPLKSLRTVAPTTMPDRPAAIQTSKSTVTCMSPDVISSKRCEPRAVRPLTPETPAGWPYRASERAEMRQTPVRINSNTRIKTAKQNSTRSRRSSKSPALRSQKEIHREAKSQSKSRRSGKSIESHTASDVSTARTTNASKSQRTSNISTAPIFTQTDQTIPPTLTPMTRQESRLPAKTTKDPDMVIETVQTHGSIEIDLCFNFRVKPQSGTGFGESRSPLKPKEVLINGVPVWKHG